MEEENPFNHKTKSADKKETKTYSFETNQIKKRDFSPTFGGSKK